jgi:flagellar biosynthesis chaperone FliJ
MKWELIEMSKLQEFRKQLNEVDQQILELEDLRESLYERIDEELEAGHSIDE